jgi:chromosomal replication initiator protein
MIDRIINEVCNYYSIPKKLLLSKTRESKIKEPRQMAHKLAKKLTRYSYKEIGYRIGEKDHATAMHSCKRINNLIDTEPQVANDYSKLLDILTSYQRTKLARMVSNIVKL